MTANDRGTGLDGSTMARARLAGLLYLLYFLAAVPLSLRSAMIVPTDAAVTAAHILAAQPMYRLTLITDLIGYVIYVVLIYLFYTLLRPVSRAWALVGALFAVIGCIVLVFDTALLTAPLVMLTDPAAHAIGVPARQELALLALKLFSQAYVIALFFFGAQWLVMGPLFIRSRLIPRPIGWLLTLGGVAWVALSIASLLAPPLAKSLQLFVLPLGAVAEIGLGLWLLIKGVNSAAPSANEPA